MTKDSRILIIVISLSLGFSLSIPLPKSVAVRVISSVGNGGNGRSHLCNGVDETIAINIFRETFEVNVLKRKFREGCVIRFKKCSVRIIKDSP